MGNQHSFQQHIDFKDLNTNYTYEKKYSDSRFGEVKLLRENSTGQQIFQKDFSTNTPKEFEQYVSSISDSTVLAHPNILRIFGYNSKKEDMFCADFYKLSLFFESFESDLEQEITTRQHTKNYFQETELWNLLDSISSACAYLQNNNIPHRDIRPFNILINSKKDYKITTTNIFGQSYNPGYFGHFDGLEARSRYYSPELLHHFSLPENKRTPFDEYKNDVFALGMTLLEAGLLEKVDNAYNFDKHEVKQAPIKDALNRLGQRYSASFVKTVESALNFDPVARLDFVRLDHELGVYRRDIRGQAKGVASSPVRTAPALSVHPEAPVYESDELDNRVREAVRKSEAVIRRSSPSKYANKNLDPYIQAYLRNDLKPTEEPLLTHISQYLTSESKYTTTLTIEQPNYGRESQPINFSQTQPREELGESFKRSAVDLAQTIPGGYQPQPVTNYGQTPSHYEPVQRTQPEQQHYLTQSGISPNYGGAHVDNYRYGATSAAGTPQQNYVQESDDLTRRIEERLKQSRQISH